MARLVCRGALAVISFDLNGLAKPKWWEYGLRFVFGGVVTAATGALARAYGATIGGLFLAFPAIVPASLTLLKQHDGRQACIEDARGAMIGSIGLIAFAILTACAAGHAPALVVLALAAGAWMSASLIIWIPLQRRLNGR